MSDPADRPSGDTLAPVPGASAPRPLRAGAYADTRVCVTGATGFIGSRVVRELLALRANVTVLAHPGSQRSARLEGVADRVRCVPVDLCDPEAIRAALEAADPQVIFHLATYYAVSNNADLGAMIDTNVKASGLLVQAAATLPGLRMFVNAGTCAEYGDFRGPANEDTPLNPNNAYASTKAAQTLLAMQLGRDLGIPLTTLRLYNIYGEAEKPDRIVPYVALSLIRGQRVELTGAEQAKDYTYLGDMVEALLLAGDTPDAAGEIINIGSGVTITVRRLVEEVAAQFEDAGNLVVFGARPYRPDEMWFQGTRTEKAERLLGWKATTPLNEGIARVVDWYRANTGFYDALS